jgi:hypothetical protein
MDELKPCPFCGRKAYWDIWTRGKQKGFKDIYGVGCQSLRCPVQPTTDSHRLKAEAIKAWNTRTEPKDT